LSPTKIDVPDNVAPPPYVGETSAPRSVMALHGGGGLHELLLIDTPVRNSIVSPARNSPAVVAGLTRPA
jgi:hypothetical protein